MYEPVFARELLVLLTVPESELYSPVVKPECCFNITKGTPYAFAHFFT
jgi:hypothetical protein